MSVMYYELLLAESSVKVQESYYQSAIDFVIYLYDYKKVEKLPKVSMLVMIASDIGCTYSLNCDIVVADIRSLELWQEDVVCVCLFYFCDALGSGHRCKLICTVHCCLYCTMTTAQ